MFFLWPVRFIRIVVETTTSCSSGIFPLKLLCRHTLSIWRQSRLVIFFLVRYSRISVNIIIIAALTFKTFDCFKQGTLVYTKDSQILINILCRLIFFFIELKRPKIYFNCYILLEMFCPGYRVVAPPSWTTCQRRWHSWPLHQILEHSHRAGNAVSRHWQSGIVVLLMT